MPTLKSPTDGQLLKAFSEKRDEDAFAETVRRLGPLVLNVCRRVLGNEADAEDAAQAAFLALARKARRSGVSTPGAWLHRVAHDIAVNLLRARTAREKREKEVASMTPRADRPAAPSLEKAALLHEEINALPDKYRQAVVLCHLEGLSLEQAAATMACPKATMGTWVLRGRERLKDRLARRGLVLSLAALTTLLSAEAGAAEFPVSFVTSTTAAAARFVAGTSGAGAGSGMLSSTSASLAEGALRKMAYAKLQMVSLVAVVLFCIAGGTGWFIRGATGAEGGGTPTEKKDTEKENAGEKEAGKKGAQEKNAQKKEGANDRAVVGSCVVTASQPLGFIDRMPTLESSRGSGDMNARITLTFDNTKGDASTLSISGAVLDDTGRRYDAAWPELETKKPWDGKIGKGEIKTLKFLARLVEHKIKLGASIRIVVVVMDEAGHKAELTSAPVRIVGAM